MVGKVIFYILIGLLIWAGVGTGLALLLGRMVGLADEIELGNDDDWFFDSDA